MQRLRSKTAEEAKPQEKEEEEKSWRKTEGLSGWFLYMLSKYIPLGVYPVEKRACTGKRVKAMYRMNLSKLKGQIGLLDISWMYEVKGALGECVIESVRISDTEMDKPLWEVVRKSKIVRLNNVEIREFTPEYLQNALSVEILGSSADQVKHQVEKILLFRKRRVRVSSKSILVFWDECKDYTLAAKHPDVLGILRSVYCINNLYLDTVEITPEMVSELKRFTVRRIKLVNCYILPLKLYDLIGVCKCLQEIEFHRTAVSPEAVEYIRKKGVKVSVSSSAS